MKGRSRGWFFTWNNYETLLDPEEYDCTYCVYQEEVGANDGTPHLQGYIYWDTLKSLGQVKEMMGDHPHLEPARSDAHAMNYCMKEETRVGGPYEYGTRPAQGKRNDLISVKSRLDTGEALSTVEQDHFVSFVRHRKFFVDYKRRRTPVRDAKTRVCLFVGPPGKGKSTLMKIIGKYLGSVYHVPSKKGSGLYFDDYDGEDVMILDEFDGSVCAPTFFNGLADEHPFILPCHGSAGHQMVSRFLFIGSNYAPKYWWRKRTNGQLLQTTRRLDLVFKVLNHVTITASTSPLATHKGPTAPHLAPIFGSYSKNLKFL